MGISSHTLSAQSGDCGSLTLGTPYITNEGIAVGVTYNNAISQILTGFEFTVTISNPTAIINRSATDNSLEGLWMTEYNDINEKKVTFKLNVGMYPAQTSIDIATIFFYMNSDNPSEPNQCTNLSFSNVIITDPVSTGPCNITLFNLENYCPPSINLKGRVTKFPETVGGIINRISGARAQATPILAVPNPLPRGETETDGFYEIPVLPQVSYNVNVIEQINTQPCDAVTTFDIVRTRKHILQIELFDKVWQHIAADVNASENVSTLDMGLMRKKILGSISFFEDGEWDFMPEEVAGATSIIFPMPNRNRLVEHPAVDKFGLDFAAIKIGDVSPNPCNDDMNRADLCNGKDSKSIFLRSTTISANGDFLMAVCVPDFTNESVFSMGFEIPANVTITGIKAGKLAEMELEEDIYKIRADGKGIDILWFDSSSPIGRSVTSVDTFYRDPVEGTILNPLFDFGSTENLYREILPSALFYIEGKAHQNYSNLAEITELSHDIVENTIHFFELPIPNAKPRNYECFEIDHTMHQGRNIHLDALNITENKNTIAAFPNPFKDKFELNITSLSTSNHNLELRNLEGKLLITKNQMLEQGNNIVIFDNLIYLPKGIYIYKIIHGKEVISGKIIKQ